MEFVWDKSWQLFHQHCVSHFKIGLKTSLFFLFFAWALPREMVVSSKLLPSKTICQQSQRIQMKRKFIMCTRRIKRNARAQKFICSIFFFSACVSFDTQNYIYPYFTVAVTRRSTTPIHLPANLFIRVCVFFLLFGFFVWNCKLLPKY